MKSRKALEKIKQILSDYKEYTPYIEKIEGELNQLNYLRDKIKYENDRHFGEKQWHLQIINDLQAENEKLKKELEKYNMLYQYSDSFEKNRKEKR